MRIAYLTPQWKPLLKVAEHLRDLGHEVDVDGKRDADVVLLMSISQQRKAVPLLKEGVRFFVYEWDMYDWAFDKPRADEYDFAKFSALCQKANEVWVPSEAERVRCLKRTGRDAFKIPSPIADLPNLEVTDEGFVLDTLRETPDPFWGLARHACDRLGIRLVQSQHDQTFPEYCRLLASCSFAVSTLKEASTGGLGLVEAARYGKTCVIPDNPENAASEYAPWGRKYKAGDVDDLTRAIEETWAVRGADMALSSIVKEYDALSMAARICERLESHGV